MVPYVVSVMELYAKAASGPPRLWELSMATVAQFVVEGSAWLVLTVTAPVKSVFVPRSSQ